MFRECEGPRCRAAEMKPTRLPTGGFDVWLTAFNSHLDAVDRHPILSSEVTQDSVVYWAGPLGCLPAETPRKIVVKAALIIEHGLSAFFAVISNGELKHIAPIAIDMSQEEAGVPLIPCSGCPKFSTFLKEDF